MNIGCSLVALASLAALCPAPLPAEVFLVANGQARTDIVIAPDPPRTVTLAAHELQEYLLKIAGASPAIVTAPGTNVGTHVYVGRSAYTDALGMSDDGLDHGAFCMVSGTNWLALVGRDRDFTPPEPHNTSRGDLPRMQAEWDALTGATWGNPHLFLYKRYNAALGIWETDERGSLNAVYEFLRSQGVRWYFPGPLGEVVPETTLLPLPQTNVVVHPDFAVRNMAFYYNEFYVASVDEVLWQLRLGLNSGEEILGLSQVCHGTKFVHTRDEIKAAHPEYYAVWDGVRAIDHKESGAPCLSSDGLASQNVDYVRAVYDIYDEPMHSVGPCDGYYKLCECALCAGKDTPERGDPGRLSDYVWGYVDRVAKEVYATHPERKVSCVAYGYYRLPPADIPMLASNVVMGWCQWRTDYRDEDAWDSYTNQIAAWMAQLPSGQMYRFDYYLHAGPTRPWFGVPVYFPHLIARDLRYLKGRSLGDYVEVYRTYTPGGESWADLAANHLNCYVTSRLWWDADQDVDALLDEYYDRFYGPARAEMKAFVEYAEVHWPDLKQSKALMDQTLELLRAAQAAAGSGIYRQRIDLLADFMAPVYTLRDSLSDHYVAQAGQTPRFPYTNWVTAASNIQTAVNAINTNGTVWVGPGRYTLPDNHVDYLGRNVVYIDKPLTLRAVSDDPADTLIDGNGAHRGIAIYYPLPSTNTFTIDGFTVTNGHALTKGGGVLIESANQAWTTVLRNCALIGNTVSDPVWAYGGGIYKQDSYSLSSLILSNCLLRGNVATNTVDADRAEAGALLVRTVGVKKLIDCTFEANVAGLAGAVRSEQGVLRVERSVFNGNRAHRNANAMWGGGGIYTTSSDLDVRNSLFSDNYSLGPGGGIAILNKHGAGYTMSLDNCTVTGNGGSGIYIRNWSETSGYFPSLQLRNCILHANTPEDVNLPPASTGAPVTNFFTNCCFTHTVFDFNLVASGNLAAPPRFADAAGGNYRLTRNSPCVNTGTNQPWMDGVFDLDGYPRKDPTSGTVDMGCYEFYSGGTLFKFY